MDNLKFKYYNRYAKISGKNKPSQYANLTLDAIEIAKKNFTKAEVIAIFKFNILKYTLRSKGQDQSDAKKIQAYASHLEDFIK